MKNFKTWQVKIQQVTISVSNVKDKVCFLQLNQSSILIKSAWTILVALYLYQFVLIYKYSVDIPFKDEWVYLKPGHPLCLPDKFNLTWLFTKISEHHIVMTNLLTWINFKIFGMDFFKQKFINYIIFGILLFTIIRFKNKIIGSANFKTFPFFLLFLLSPIAVENHSWAFQSQIHLVLLFFLLMLIYMSGDFLSTSKTVLFLSVSTIAIYSFAAGVILALICLFFRTLQIISLATKNQCSRRSGLINTAVCTTIIGTVTALWFMGYKRPEYIPPGVWPTEWAFWDYFLNLLSFGFGFDTQNPLPGALFLFLSLFPIVIFSLDKKRRFEPDVLCISAAIIAVLAVLMSISFGRASLGDSKTSRYVEISFLLIPLIAMAWWLLLRNSPIKQILLPLLWVTCFCSYLDNWSPAQYYDVYLSDKNTLDCVNNYYEYGGNAACQDFWITPAHLDKAKQLNINFTKHLMSANQP